MKDPAFGVLLVLLLIVASILIYFLPALIARRRLHRNATAILVLNWFLGWTFLGWVIALIWAFTNDREN
jgi:hypothetical protein